MEIVYTISIPLPNHTPPNRTRPNLAVPHLTTPYQTLEGFQYTLNCRECLIHMRKIMTQGGKIGTMQ